MEEIWKDIKGYEGLYHVSTLGRVRSSYSGKVLKPLVKQNGYLSIMLYKDKIGRRFYVHYLVATAFCDGYAEGLEVNHKDEDKINNSADNLEWVTHIYNQRYSHLQERLTKSKLKSVVQYDLQGNRIASFHSINEAARSTGFDPRHICKCCKGIIKQEKGFTWKYEKSI